MKTGTNQSAHPQWVYQHTPEWLEEEQPQGSSCQGLSIHNKKKIFWKSGSITFSGHLKWAAQGQPWGRRTGGPFLQADIPRRAWGVRHRGHGPKTGASLINSCWGLLLWLVWPAINWISMFWIGEKKISPCSLLLPFLELPAGIFCHSAWLPAVGIIHLIKKTCGKEKVYNSRSLPSRYLWKHWDMDLAQSTF